MSLRDRAAAAAREDRERQARTGPTDAQIMAAGILSEVLECEVEPLDCEARAQDTRLIVAAEVDGIKFRLPLTSDNLALCGPLEVEAGRRALKRWATFSTLADLDALLD